MKTFKGNVLFLDRSDINTDEIIPARYLTEIEKKAMKPHLLEDLEMDGFDPKTDIDNKAVVVTRENFGCGSSREHAPWALEVNDINVVIASSFARIFRQNMYNCGMMAIELSNDALDKIFDTFANQETQIDVDVDKSVITVTSGTISQVIEFAVSEFDRALVKTGGWVEYADKHY